MNAREFIREEWPLLLLLALPFVALPFVWDALPDRLPVHWNLQGEPDRYGSKTEGLLLLPGLNVLTYLLILISPKLDPKRRIAAFVKPLPAIRFVTVLFMDLFFFAILYKLFNPDVLLVNLIFLLTLCLFAVLGNYMHAVQPNYFIGFRLPWTLEDPAIWRKTHRVAARFWTVGAIAALLVWPLAGAVAFRYAFFVYVSAAVAVPLVYSLYLYFIVPGER